MWHVSGCPGDLRNINDLRSKKIKRLSLSLNSVLLGCVLLPLVEAEAGIEAKARPHHAVLDLPGKWHGSGVSR